MNDKTDHFTETVLFTYGSLNGEIKYDEGLGHFCHIFKKQNHTLILYIFFYFRSSALGKGNVT